MFPALLPRALRVSSITANSINMGLPILECPEWSDEGYLEKVTLCLWMQTRELLPTKPLGQHFMHSPSPPFIQEIINDGGLVARTKRVMAEKAGE